MLAPALIALFAANGLIPTASAGLLINEILYDASGADDGLEWVEICNSGSSSVDLTGYQLESAGSSWTESYTFGAGSLAPGEYAIVGYGGTTWTGNFTPNLPNGGSESDGLRLKDSTSVIIDSVIYDSPNTTGLVDDSGSAATGLAPTASSARSIGRFPDCADPNDSGVDFVLYTAPNPGVANIDPSSGTDTGTASGADCSVTDGVTINEFTPATGVEWVELYNDNSAAIDLGGWELAYGTATFSKTVAVPDGTVLPAYGWIVLGSAGAAVKDVSISFDPGNATSSADAMRLECNGAAVDTVIYGDADTNADGWMDDDGNVTTSFAPVPGSGESSARVADGQDTNQSGADFAVSSAPSPGASNPVIVCDIAGGAVVRLNEFLYDPGSTDGGKEWVELYNNGTTAVRLDGYQIETATSSWGVDFVFPPSTEIAPGGFLLIGGDGVADIDYQADSLSLGNGGDGDGLRLVDCAGTVVDTVLYGDTMADGLTGEDGSEDVVASVDSDVSIGRSTDGVDTNAVADWMAFSTVTPGAPNGSDPGDSGTDTDKGGGGCGGNRPTSTRPGASCAVSTPLSGGEVFLAALVLLRRKRRTA